MGMSSTAVPWLVALVRLCAAAIMPSSERRLLPSGALLSHSAWRLHIRPRCSARRHERGQPAVRTSVRVRWHGHSGQRHHRRDCHQNHHKHGFSTGARQRSSHGIAHVVRWLQYTRHVAASDACVRSLQLECGSPLRSQMAAVLQPLRTAISAHICIPRALVQHLEANTFFRSQPVLLRRLGQRRQAADVGAVGR